MLSQDVMQFLYINVSNESLLGHLGVGGTTCSKDLHAAALKSFRCKIRLFLVLT